MVSVAATVKRLAIAAFICLLFCSNSVAWAAEQPLTLQVLNYQSFGGADLQNYMMRMKEQIRSRWHPSKDAPHATRVFFQVFADGSLLQHSIEESSGDKSYDDEAKTVIEGCAPFASPPPGAVRLINIVATFGIKSGGSGAVGSSAPEQQNNSPMTASNPATNPIAPGEGGNDNGSASPPRTTLQGEANTTTMQSSASSGETPSHFLQGGVGETGSYSSPPLQAQAMATAPPPPMFQPRIAMQAPLQASAQNAQPGFYQSQVEHGQQTIGVLGCEFGLLNNQIRQIMPGSDLLRYGITPGDIIEAADGQALRGKAMQAYIRGVPGTYVQLTILHQGRMMTMPVQRKDTRMFSNYNGYFRKWAAQEKFW